MMPQHKPTDDELERQLAVAKAALETAHEPMPEALMASKERLRTTLHSIGDAVITTDLQGRISDMNPVAETLANRPLSQARGKPIADLLSFFDLETRRPARNPVDIVVASRALRLATAALVITSEGKELHVSTSTAPILSDDGAMTGVVLVLRDETTAEHTRRLVQLRLGLIEFAATHTVSELLTRTLDEAGALINSPIGFYHFLEPDQKTRTLQQWSTRTRQEFCRAEGEGSHYGIDQAGVWVDCVQARGPVIHNDYASLPHKKGLPPGHAPIVRELVVPVIRDDRVVAIMGLGNKPTDYGQGDARTALYMADVSWEIVRQKQAQEAVQHERDRANRYLDVAGVMLLVIDDRGDIVRINRKGQEILGYEDEDLVGRNWFESFLPAHVVDEVKAIFAKLMSGEIEAGEHAENVIITRSGEERVISWHNTILRDDDGRIIGTLSSGEDITEQRRAETERERLLETLARTNDELVAKNTELEQVVYVVSHDLRSPLVNIDGYARELDYSLEDLRHALARALGPRDMPADVATIVNEDIPEALAYIRGSAHKMDGLLKGLLRLSRSGRATLRVDSLDMNALVAEVIEAFDYQIQQGGIDLAVDDLPPCHSDAMQVNQIFANLVGNALKYLDPDRPGVIRMRGWLDGVQAVYCVEDNGIGIAPAHMGKVFEIFHRLDPSRGEGEGLGLAIVNRIVSRLGGSVWAESQEGVGSRFFVALPTNPERTQEQEADAQ